ncbi:MAG TPA: nucleotidyl transferase AbiEii/AbiGii toxin family protein [Thermoanaerobaculia bacterium]|nr:nucleotidyl transferase AbiEii/AbiGii toxin family protein [Thermoanaerobaculia bacterium]
MTAPPSLIPRHREALSPRAQALAGSLAATALSEDFYLAGGAALALYLGHRPVAELDLMSGTNRLAGPERRILLGALLDADPDTQVETARDGYLFVRAGGGVPLRLYYYPYPLVAPVEEVDGLAVVSPVDLGLMKLGAIISRGSRRDFVDLFLLCRELPLDQLLLRAGDKFGHVRDFPLQALKGLADLSEAAGEAMPRLAVDVTWEEVAAWVGGEVREAGRTLWPTS